MEAEIEAVKLQTKKCQELAAASKIREAGTGHVRPQCPGKERARQRSHSGHLASKKVRINLFFLSQYIFVCIALLQKPYQM